MRSYTALAALALLSAHALAAPVNLNELKDRMVRQLLDPVKGQCKDYNLKDLAPRYGCNLSFSEKVTFEQVNQLFTEASASLKGSGNALPVVATSYYAKPDDIRVFGLHKGAGYYFIGYGKGCDWRAFAPDNLKKSGRLMDLKAKPESFETYKPYIDQAYKESCTWFGIATTPAQDDKAGIPETAQLTSEF